MALLLIAHAALAFSASTRKSVTYDEVAHLTAGYSYWTTRDFRLVPEHPPLAELWAALPLMAADLAFPPLDQPAWWGSDQWTLGRAFLFTLGNDLSFMLGASRFMIVVLSAALGLGVFFWSKRLFGTAGGFVSLVLYALSPTTLAHAALVTTDMAVALFFTLAVCASWSVLQRVTALRVAAGGLAVAGLLLAKMSGLLILPMLVVMVVVRVASRAPLPVVLGKRWTVGPRVARVRVLAGVAVVQTCIVWGLIWAAYGFRFDAMVDAEPGRDRFGVYMQRVPDGTSWDQELAGAGAAAPLIASALDLRLLPEAYLYGIAHTINSTRVRQAFLNGRRTMHGFTAFFPYCLLVKTPLPLFGVIILALIAYAARRRRGTRGADDPPVTTIMAYDTIPAWTLLVVYLCVSMASPMNIGHRHILPIYPVLFLVAGAAASLLRHPRRLARWSVPAMLAAHAAVSLTTWPNYIAFFNTTVGGPRTAYRQTLMRWWMPLS
ncbi:MAG: ArnT family glycosyltransferase, partial [Phycisphaerae bacterium]